LAFVPVKGQIEVTATQLHSATSVAPGTPKTAPSVEGEPDDAIGIRVKRLPGTVTPKGNMKLSSVQATVIVVNGVPGFKP